ncbi:hypothetical protein OG2516_09018 [Oceanicola granulosus HTCC2516]|uniref:Uncharacterized protein n=1 Tax=Oceanicola granulosus (strain ATCC BAA-861 / DSM 15982 / KCTC 12143 / HTCC2516) TaxID=314256 RepID=Q2CCP6_OCEGH|nr:hypothetical protein [Oceanicola granulosus]EAR50467.1 hypothetical protein OG2516_09018 [Oceanicola granulosus HTCC2516]
MFTKSKSLFAATAALGLFATGALAQDQEGLVNVSVDDNTVQVPVSVAANVCDVDVNVLTEQFVGSEETACEIDQSTAAQNGINTGNGGNGDNAGGNGQQNGLVNLSVDGNTVQAPIGVAANVCGVEANVIAQDFQGTDETVCEISQEQAAENGLSGAAMDDDAMTGEAEDAAEDAEDAAEDAADAAEDEAEDAADEVEDEAEDETDD